MNLYSNKQKWKVALLIFALLTVGVTLFVSNDIVSKVGDRERERAKQWADAIKKKIELVRLTNRTFTQLRDKEREKMGLWIDATKEVSKSSPLNQALDQEIPLKIINGNKDIPVILLDHNQNVSGSINLDFDTSYFRKHHPDYSVDELFKAFDDSLLLLAKEWEQLNSSFTIEVYDDMFMTYYYSDSREIVKLENERDSLINAFNDDLINNAGLVPVLLIDTETKKIIGTNIEEVKNDVSHLEVHISKLSKQNEPIVIDLKGGVTNTLYFDASPELKKLQYFPYIQFIVVGLFALIGYLIFSTFRKAEQNKVWAGMAKETAHQLGTPLSSLMAWIQLLEAQGVDPMIIVEMQKDVDRLDKVSNRFSKIGSGAQLSLGDVSHTVKNVLDYLRPRISDKVDVRVSAEDEVLVLHNASLLEWVVENICKNAVDAMEGVGLLHVHVHKTNDWAYIDIQDTGKGIPSKQLKTIFEPGFSTKTRGWGLGLSLVKRIVKEYHKGTVYVLESKINVGTTFRICLPLNVVA